MVQHATNPETRIANPAIQPMPDQVMSRAEYHRWIGARPNGRFERVEGRVVVMAPERRSHEKRKALVWLALHRAVEAVSLPCEVYPDGMTVEVGDNDFEPDAILRCGESLADDGTKIPDPLVVVEVLSPSPRSVDPSPRSVDPSPRSVDNISVKLVAYFRMPSIRHDLIFWPDRPQVIHQRQDAGSLITTRFISAGALRLDPPGIWVALADAYAEPSPEKA